MQGLAKNLGCGAGFDNTARVYHRNAIGESGKQRGIVTDHNHRDAVLKPNPREQRDNFRLQGSIQLAGRFVRDNQRGIARDCLSIVMRWRWPPLSW